MIKDHLYMDAARYEERYLAPVKNLRNGGASPQFFAGR
jgi:hypothetical protein